MSEYIRRKELAERGRRRNRIILSGIILATLPFYCAGIIAYVFAPGGAGSIPTSTPIPTTQSAGDGQPVVVTQIPTNTPFATLTSLPALQATPTSPLGVPPTTRPLFTSTPTVTPVPTLTFTPQSTATPLLPTNTPVPEITNTPIPFD